MFIYNIKNKFLLMDLISMMSAHSYYLLHKESKDDFKSYQLAVIILWNVNALCKTVTAFFKAFITFLDQKLLIL